MSHTKVTKALAAGWQGDPDPVEGEVGLEPGAPDPSQGTPDPTERAPETQKTQRRKKPEGPPCRVCGMMLGKGAESAIGVHIWCVANSRFNRINIPRPTYGSRR